MPVTRRLAPAALAVLLLAGLAPRGAAAAEPDFPAGHEGYHTYAEVEAVTAAVAAAHPDIAQRFSIGRSHEGRELWAMKISDDVATDEPEPEVLFDGGHHGDEHMAVEMALAIMRWLVDGYGTDPRITRIVDNREVWIVFSMNPDGAEYDIRGGSYRFWRKNRQPNAGSKYVGTDLNRNYDYRWGGGGNTSTNPQAITYRGPSAFSAPETRAMRDFLRSRVVGGRQQIRTYATFHEYGRLVMWPYGYTSSDVPGDMSRADHDALRVIGRTMGSLSGYRPQQASDLYITSGTSRDYAYGKYRIFAYTFELSNDDYLDDSRIASETGRNRAAVLYLLDRASCPHGVLGAHVATARCGAFDDDLEVWAGWTTNPDGTDTATTAARGAFARSDPASTSSSGPKQLGTVPSGSRAFVTGATAGSSATANDLDGRTSIRSRPIVLPATSGQRLFFRYVFAHSATSSAADGLTAYVEEQDGDRVPVWSVSGAARDRDGAWTPAYASLDPWAGQTIRLRFVAVDGGPGNLLEVELDDIRVMRPS
ncbi:MAG: M14 family zinc carboxypeptidase [Candidatus Limnocylindria bacterium]